MSRIVDSVAGGVVILVAALVAIGAAAFMVDHRTPIEKCSDECAPNIAMGYTSPNVGCICGFEDYRY